MLLIIIGIGYKISYTQELLFYCNNSSGTFQVYSKNLLNNEIESVSSDNNFNYWWVEPSPNGTELLMMRSPIGTDIEDQFDYETSQMIKANVDGTSEIVILDYQAFDWIAFGNPHWHPNGNKILLLAQPASEFFIFTLDIDGSNPVQLTNQFSIDPHWSHKGDKIVYIGINPNPTPPLPSFEDFEVYTADYSMENNSVSNIQQLTDDERRDHDPCFSPNDDQIAFSSATNVNLSIANITVIDTLGNNRTDLVNDNTTNGGPVNWGSNNKIYYHNVNFNNPPFTPFTAKEYDVDGNINTDLFPSISEGYISPYYFNSQTLSASELNTTKNVTVYPNPASNLITFNSEDSTDKKVLILNQEGKIIKEYFFKNSLEFDITSYSQGYYFYQLLDKDEIENGVIIKIE